jgi:hypothetical protein
VRRTDSGYRLRTVLSAPEAATATSPLTAAVPHAPRSAARPTITGHPLVGALLRGHRGSWVGTDLVFDYRWLRCGDPGCTKGATVARTITYRLREVDKGRRLKLLVTARNSSGRATASSALTARIR